MELSEHVNAKLDVSDFALGQYIDERFQDTLNISVKSQKYQSCTNNPDYKQILILGLKSAKEALLGNNLITIDKYHKLIENISTNIVNNNIKSLKYVTSTICSVERL